MAREPGDPRDAPSAAHASDREQRLLRQVAILAQRLLSARAEDLDREIEECLQQAAAVAGADRSFLTVFGLRGGPPASYEWIQRGLETRLPDADPDSASRYPWATARVSNGLAIVCPDPSKLPDEAWSEREQLLRREVKSLLTLPIQPGERVIGFQIFECLREPRDWSEAEISLLRIVTEIFASSVVARRTEAALLASEKRFRAIAENAPQLVAEVGTDGGIRYVAPQVFGLLGYADRELRGRDARSLIHPGDDAALAELVGGLGGGDKVRVELRARHADGSWRWFDTTARGYVDERGEARIVVVADDVTERRALREALRESQAQLFHSQKMEAVGRLAGGVAHDFNNLLLVIGGNVQEALDEGQLPPRARQSVHDALAAVDRASSLTRQLLSFSRRDMLHPSTVDLNEVVSSMEALLSRVVGEHIQLRVELQPRPAIVRSDRGQLEQVLVNLAVNARDAMPDGGELFLRTETRELDEDEARRGGLEHPGRYHALVVRDTGTGIDPEVADHVFEPFYTTKDPGKGTGLGLSIVYGVAHQAGGTVRLSSAPGEGASFEVLVPASQSHEVEEVEEPREMPRGARGRLLLVEDEPAVRRLVTRMLERSGYDVIVAEDAEDGLALASDMATPIDLLVSDVVMPGVGGPELARRLRERWPGLAVLFISGYPRDFRPGDAPADDAFLSKPFTQEQLLRAVSAQLERSGG